VIALTLREIADIVGGELHADPDAVVDAPLEFDSRRIAPGGLFLAIPGEHADGHDFVEQAIHDGAVAAIVTRLVDAACIVVADSMAAIAALAAAVIRRLPDVTVIAVTGSSGKTSTKDLIAGLLARLGPTVAPPGSFNNELGHPYTVLLADASTRFLVLEASARGIGHIRFLAGIAPPDIAVVLNVGSAHLGEFGTREAIARAKAELVQALTSDGVAVLNADDASVLAMRSQTAARVVTVGESAGADLRAHGVQLDDRGRAFFTLVSGTESAEVHLLLTGEHHVGNALSAAAVAIECGLPLPDVAAALSRASAQSRWRMEVTERGDGVLIVNDAYNANPESMRAALKALAGIGRARGARTFAVLGPMGELGADSRLEHDAVGRLAVRLDISRLIAIGEAARPLAHGAALEGSWNGESSWVADPEAALEVLRADLQPGDVVLVKASRAARLERLAQSLIDDDGLDPGRNQT
jgi:UDP-N-acetylmuramoyl-tripeptide--D-alanyl-D-alanine ligase